MKKAEFPHVGEAPERRVRRLEHVGSKGPHAHPKVQTGSWARMNWGEVRDGQLADLSQQAERRRYPSSNKRIVKDSRKTDCGFRQFSLQTAATRTLGLGRIGVVPTTAGSGDRSVGQLYWARVKRWDGRRPFRR